jgi:mono/diheme cytochrome c family protein
MVLTWILGFALLGSVGAISAAALFLLFPKPVREQLVPFLVSYATRALLGGALLHGWGDRLSDQEMWDVLSYVRTLAPFNPVT